MKTKVGNLFFVAALLTTVTGCSVLTSNNRELLDARTQLSAGKWSDALEALGTRDDLCAVLDRATIDEAHGDLAQSNAEFDKAIDKVRQYEDRATISATEVGTGAGSLLLNDKTLEYQGEGYEKVLMHAFKARNYLILGDAEAARVEIRNADMRQDEERKKHEDEIDAAQKKAKEEKVNFNALSQQIDKQFSSSSAILSRLDNVYQDPFATYLSGIVYEMNDEPGEAFVDYKNAYQMTHNPLVEADLTRLAASLHREDELAAFGVQPTATPGQEGNTVVFIDNGFAPARVQVKFPIPEPDTVLFAAVPMSQPVPTNLDEADVLDGDGNVIGHTHMMVDIEAMSVRNLHDHYPAILVRQAVRLAAKAAAGHVAQREAGLAGLLVSSVFNAVTEQADLRTWYSLPRSIHVARVNLPEGQHEVQLRLLDASGQSIRDVSVPVVRVNPRLNVAALRYMNGMVLVSTPSTTQVAREGQP